MALSNGRELQLLPAGEFRARDGRPADAPTWLTNSDIGAALIAAAAARGTPYVIDYEHQTMLARENGKPAPAAGWFSELEWRDGAGLFAVDVEWTANAQEMIAANEYRYISPVIGYDRATGAVTSLYMAAITNNPAIDGMDNVLLAAAALSFSLSPPTPLRSLTMELLEQLRWMLNLPIAATEADITAELQKLIDQIKKEEPTAVAAASFDLASYLGAQRTAIATLSTQTPDPMKFVPIEALQAVQAQAATLTAQANTGRVTEAVDTAMTAGKLVPSMKAWAVDLGNKDFAALSAYIETAPVIVALGGTQTGGKPPAGGDGIALTASQVALCTTFGIAPEDYQKTLKAEAVA
ncbi:MAG: phage protease [Pseudomonadota bacterium]|nr:phage protease [Pseudomonadota bacterium]